MDISFILLNHLYQKNRFVKNNHCNGFKIEFTVVFSNYLMDKRND